MTDTRDLRDDDLRALVRAAGSPAGIDFRAGLRARLTAAIDGDVELDPVEPASRRRTWLPLVAAAAVVALVIGTIALIARDRDPVVVPSSDLATQLVGRTWVALDGVPPGDLPTLVMKIGATRPDVIIVNGDDGCNDHSGEFRLDGATVVDAEILQSQKACPDGETATMPMQGALLSLQRGLLTVSSGQDASTYRAIESLPTASVHELDGVWRHGDEQFAIGDGRVMDPAPDGVTTEIDRALAADTLAAWVWDDVLVVRTPTTGFRLLEPVRNPAPTTLLDQLVGRTWVGVGGAWQTAAPTLVFDSLNREPGLSAVSVFDGCNTGEGTFELDGATMVATEIGMTKIGCPHRVAGLVDGTNLAVTDGSLAVTATDGLTTSYVALDSLEPVPATELAAALDGVWEFAGSIFSIDGDTVGSHGSAPTAVWELVSDVVHGDGVEAWHYHGDDLVLRDGTTFVVLVRSDLPVGGSPVVTTGPISGGDDALITGTVTFESDCLVVTLEGIRYPVVWQPGTAWNGRDRVILPDGVNLPLGQAIEAGGGYYSIDQLATFGVDATGIETMRGCAERIGPEIAVVQSPVTLQFPVEADG